MTLTEFPSSTMRSAPLATSLSHDGNITVVAFRGEADLSTLPVVSEVLAQVIADSDGPVVIDLADTDFIDAGTMRALASAWQLLDDRGRTLTLRSPSELTTRMLGLLDLSHLTDENPAPIGHRL